MSGKEVSSFFTGFFVGALIGGATALLLAPQSGEETRAQIRDAGIELKEKAGPYVQRLMEKGVIALLAGATVIRLLPPLVISMEEIDTVVSALEEIL